MNWQFIITTAISLLSLIVAIIAIYRAWRSEKFIHRVNIYNERCKIIIGLLESLYLNKLNKNINVIINNKDYIFDDKKSKIESYVNQWCENFIEKYNTNKIFIDDKFMQDLDSNVDKLNIHCNSFLCKVHVEYRCGERCLNPIEFLNELNCIVLNIRESLYKQMSEYYEMFIK